jgi:hypothetical protein
MKGVDYQGGTVCGGVMVLNEQDIRAVMLEMRRRLLNFHAEDCNSWHATNVPLANLQDIMRFGSDVAAFEQFAIWLAYPYQRSEGDDTPTEIVFS